MSIKSMTTSVDYLNTVLFEDARQMVEELQFLTHDYMADVLPRSSTEDREFCSDDQDGTYYESTR